MRQFSWSIFLSLSAFTLSLLTFALWVNTHSPTASFSSTTQTRHAFELAVRNQVEGAKPDQIMFGQNQSLIADVAEQVAPAVVNIDVEKTNATPSTAGLHDVLPFSEDFLKRFLGIRPEQFQAQPQTVSGNGSGVILNQQGFILTNYHVVSSASDIMVTLNDGRKFPARVVGKDRFTDLAVVKIDADKLQPAVMGSSNKLRPGEWVIAVGSPLGFDHTVTLGIISAISRRVPDINNNVQFIQTDAAINPGNSGGPLVNLKGEVIGINTAISGIAQNIGFAIPVDAVRQVADTLMASGSIQRPWVGLSMSPVTPKLAKALGIPETTEGVVISQVLPNSPSAKADFHQGDVIQRVDGKAVTDPKSVQDLVRNKPIKSTFNFQVLRDGQMVGVSLQSAVLPDDPEPQPN